MKRLFCAALLLAAGGSAARADFVTYTSAAAFDAAVASVTVESFEPTGSPGTLPAPGTTLSFPGFTVTGGTQELGVFANGFAGQPGNQLSYSTTVPEAVTFTFGSPVTAFGLTVGDFGTIGGGTFAVGIDGSTFTAATGPLAGGNVFFFGVTSDTPFTSVSVRSTDDGDFIALDDVRFGQAAPTGGEVPAPPAAVLAGLAALGLVRLRRKAA